MSSVIVPSVTKRSARAFLDYAQGAYSVWALFRGMIDRPEYVKALDTCRDRDWFSQIVDIVHRHFMLQVAKLHDRTVVAGRVTMSLNYFLDAGAWNKRDRIRLAGLKRRMDKHMGIRLTPARHQILAHNDLEVHTLGQRRGRFLKGGDTKYFKCLQSFINIIGKKYGNGICPFGAHSRTDSIAFLGRLAKRGVINVPGVEVTPPHSF